MAERKKRRVRNTFNYDTGLPVMVNLRIIRTIYYGMKDKADRFVEDGSGRKKRYIPVYGEEILNISRSRYDRLQRGAPFEVSDREANDLAERFNISRRYFRRDEPEMFDVAGLDALDWKCFYIDVHEIEYELEEGITEDEIKKRAGAVKEELQKLVNKEWSAVKDNKDPIFYIWYFFRTGRKYEKISPAVKCMEELRGLGLEEWERFYGKTELEQYRDILKKHYDYVNALVTIKNLR